MLDFLKPYECDVCHKRYWSSHDAFKCCEGTPEWNANMARLDRQMLAQGRDPKTGKKLKNPPKMNQGEPPSFETYTVECNWCNGTGKKNGLPCDWCGGSGRLPRP